MLFVNTQKIYGLHIFAYLVEMVVGNTEFVNSPELNSERLIHIGELIASYNKGLYVGCLKAIDSFLRVEFVWLHFGPCVVDYNH